MKFPAVMWTFAIVMPCSTCLSLPVPSSPSVSEEEELPKGTRSSSRSPSLVSFTPSSSSSSQAVLFYSSSLIEMKKGSQRKEDTDPEVTSRTTDTATRHSSSQLLRNPRSSRATKQRPASRKRRRHRKKCQKHNKKRRHRKHRKCHRSRKGGRRGRNKKRKQKKLTKSGKRRRRRRRQRRRDKTKISEKVDLKKKVAKPKKVHRQNLPPTEVVSVFDNVSPMDREGQKQTSQRPPHIGFHELQSGFNSTRPLKTDRLKSQHHSKNPKGISPVTLTPAPQISRTNQKRYARAIVSVLLKRSVALS